MQTDRTPEKQTGLSGCLVTSREENCATPGVRREELAAAGDKCSPFPFLINIDCVSYLEVLTFYSDLLGFLILSHRTGGGNLYYRD